MERRLKQWETQEGASTQSLGVAKRRDCAVKQF